jgi:hypothetical protein
LRRYVVFGLKMSPLTVLSIVIAVATAAKEALKDEDK